MALVREVNRDPVLEMGETSRRTDRNLSSMKDTGKPAKRHLKESQIVWSDGTRLNCLGPILRVMPEGTQELLITCPVPCTQ